MKRIFIGVKIDAGDNLRKLISGLKTSLKDEKIKWTVIENFHITLAFLGDTDEDKIVAISKMLMSACEDFGEFKLSVKGAGIFKNFKEPRIIWTGIEASERMNELYVSVMKGLKDTGISLEDRPFNPHLTIGRIKSIGDTTMLKDVITDVSNLELQEQQINDVILYESILSPDGPFYRPLGKFPLTPAFARGSAGKA